MIEIRQTDIFSKWLSGLRDRLAKARILVRIDRLRLGLTGDARPVGGGVSELRVDQGPGYRVYFTWRGHDLVVLLVGGDKSSQTQDIRKARGLVKSLED
jgi:putative addiction module killer protein